MIGRGVSVALVAVIAGGAGVVAPPAQAAELRVRVEGGTPGEGRALVQLYRAKVAWMQAPVAQAEGAIGPDGAGEAVFADVNPGPAAVVVLYDRDGDGAMTLGDGGRPVEWLSFSNDAATGLDVPEWEGARFVIAPEGTTITIQLQRGLE